VNLPPLFEPKTENFFTTLRPPQEGQATVADAVPTSRSNSLPQRQHANSNSGTPASSPP
jgi:hypothetical protein